MINRETKISELKCYFSDEEFKEKYNISFDDIEDSYLNEIFDDLCERHKTIISISDLYNNYAEQNFLISTPDGFQEVGVLMKKKKRPIFTIKTASGNIKCSNDHLIETINGWMYAENIRKQDLILTKTGFVNVTYIRKGKAEDVYDLEVLHPNQRYWGGTGISSHNTGKSFLAISTCREAQKKGYTPIYFDSEGAIDKDFVERLGCDASKFIIKQVTTISEVSTFIANYCQKLLSLPIEKRPKTIMVLDSLGNLTSTKELTDTIDGSGKRDMTKQQEIKALFRTNATALAKLGILFIVNSHTYQTTDLFSKTIVSGGCILPEEKIYTETGLKQIKDVAVGEKVLTADGTYQSVLEKFEYHKEVLIVKLANRKELTCSLTHRFLIDKDFHKEESWKTAETLKPGEKIYIYENGNLVEDEVYSIKGIFNTRRNHLPVFRKMNVVDLCVENNHCYITENGIINHNSGIAYNASVTLILSTAKLDDKDSDKIAEKKTGDFIKTGVIVTARPEKSRFTIPQKVRFQIPYFKKPNPYVGLEAYLTWENSGILRGKLLTQKEWDKASEADRQLCKDPIELEDGSLVYPYPKDNSKNIVVKHLKAEVPLQELFTEKVLTQELLENLDEIVIRPNFELPSQFDDTDLDELVEAEVTEI